VAVLMDAHVLRYGNVTGEVYCQASEEVTLSRERSGRSTKIKEQSRKENVSLNS
jgi:hypothetical protein